MYKRNDIVLIKSLSGKAIPRFHVKLLKKIIVKPEKGNRINWPGYVGWDCLLVYPKEADLLRKKCGIPFKFPNKIKTFVFEEEIIAKKQNRRNKRKRIAK